MKKHIYNLALLGVIVTGILIGINKTISVIANNSDNLPIGRGKFYKWKYGDIYYTKVGSGSPLLLIHNRDVASSAYEWNKVINKLSENHTVYALDLLGCGRSEKPNVTYTNYMYVQLCNDFIKNIIKAKTSIICTGASVSTAVMACQMAPELYDKIIGISPADLYDLAKTPGQRKNILKWFIEMPVIGTFIYNINTSRFHITEKLTKRKFYKDYLVSTPLINANYKAAHTGDGKGRYLLASIKCHYTNTNIVPTLKKINHSIFLIGGNGVEFMEEILADYVEYNPAIETSLIPDTGFYPHLETPEKVIELLDIYLA